MPRRSLAAPAAVLLLAACGAARAPAVPTAAVPATGANAEGAGAGAAATAPAPRPAGQPLASLAGERVVVVPAQRLRADTLADAAPAGANSAFLHALDSLVGAQLAERGVAWPTPADVERAARRNPTYSPDPHRLAVNALLAGRRPPQDGAVADPLASQLRTIVALSDARYVVVPSEVRVERDAAGAARAVLRLVLVDARAAQLRWAGDVASEPAAAAAPVLSPAAAATLAARFADLIAAP
jgi:hypothetical protein